MYVTQKRPATEPYRIWKARQRLQQKEVDRYLKGRIVWLSSVLVNVGTYRRPKWEKKVVNGTYCKGIHKLEKGVVMYGS